MTFYVRLIAVSRSYADWEVTAPNATYRFGTSAASAGDVNGDSYDDVIIGGNEAYVYLGSESGLSATPAFTSGHTCSSLNWRVASDGDVNGDGYAKVIIGDFSNDPWWGATGHNIPPRQESEGEAPVPAPQAGAGVPLPAPIGDWRI